jgi:hypothetical protein
MLQRTGFLSKLHALEPAPVKEPASEQAKKNAPEASGASLGNVGGA